MQFELTLRHNNDFVLLTAASDVEISPKKHLAVDNTVADLLSHLVLYVHELGNRSKLFVIVVLIDLVADLVSLRANRVFDMLPVLVDFLVSHLGILATSIWHSKH